MNIVESVREFIKTCPYLDEFHRGIGVDFLKEKETSYMIESVPADPVVKTYLGGDTVRQFVFAFSSRESYGEDVRQNLENTGFYEHFADWMEEQTKSKKLPELGEGKQAMLIEATSTGYPYDTDVKTAQYRIQCRLVYFQKR